MVGVLQSAVQGLASAQVRELSVVLVWGSQAPVLVWELAAVLVWKSAVALASKWAWQLATVLVLVDQLWFHRHKHNRRL